MCNNSYVLNILVILYQVILCTIQENAFTHAHTYNQTGRQTYLIDRLHPSFSFELELTHFACVRF